MPCHVFCRHRGSQWVQVRLPDPTGRGRPEYKGHHDLATHRLHFADTLPHLRQVTREKYIFTSTLSSPNKITQAKKEGHSGLKNVQRFGMEALYSHYFSDRVYIAYTFLPQHTAIPDSLIHCSSGSSRCGGDGGAVHEHRSHIHLLYTLPAYSISQPTATAMANSEGAAIEDDLTLVHTGKARNRGPGKATQQTLSRTHNTV